MKKKLTVRCQSPHYRDIGNSFLDYLEKKNYCYNSVYTSRKRLNPFLCFLEEENIKQISDVDSAVIDKYIQTLLTGNFRTVTIRGKVKEVRIFFDYLKEKKFIAKAIPIKFSKTPDMTKEPVRIRCGNSYLQKIGDSLMEYMIEKNYTFDSINTYKRGFGTLFSFFKKERIKDIREVNSETIDKYLQKITRGQLKNSTIDHKMNALRVLLNFMEEKLGRDKNIKVTYSSKPSLKGVWVTAKCQSSYYRDLGNSFADYMKEKNFAPGTVFTYKAALDHFFEYLGGENINHVSGIDSDIADKFIKMQIECKYQKATICNYASAMNNFFNFLEDRLGVKKNLFINLPTCRHINPVTIHCSNPQYKEEGNAFLAHLKMQNYSSESFGTYKYGLENFFAYLIRKKIKRIQEVDIDTFCQYRLKLVRNNYKSKTIERTISAVKRFFLYLESESKVFFNPAKDFQYPQPEYTIQYIPTEEEMIQFLDFEASSPLRLRDKALLETAYSCAARRNEFRMLKIHDCSFTDGTLRIFGKGRKERVVPLGKHALFWLRKYMLEGRHELLRDKNEQALFLNAWGRRMSKGAVDYMIQLRQKQIGLPITIHAIRRACATHMLKAGAHPANIQMLLGHSDFNSLKQYLQVSITDLKETHAKCIVGQ